MLKALLFLLVVNLITTGRLFAAEHTDDPLTEVKKNVDDGRALLIDVREKREWQGGHLRAAALLPLSVISKDPKAKPVQEALSKKKIIYLHCKSGGRCRIAADLLKDSRYDLRPLKAGYSDLLKAGFEKAKE